MEASDLKMLFDNGSLVAARIESLPLSKPDKEEWTLSIVTANGETKQVTRVRTNDPKIYKSLGAVMSDLRRIGFRRAEVCL